MEHIRRLECGIQSVAICHDTASISGVNCYILISHLQNGSQPIPPRASTPNPRVGAVPWRTIGVKASPQGTIPARFPAKSSHTKSEGHTKISHKKRSLKWHSVTGLYPLYLRYKTNCHWYGAYQASLLTMSRDYGS